MLNPNDYRRAFLFPRRAFTLIELLVVIAIIALLVSILLPALAQARRTARQAVCMSNMRQMSVAYQSYGNEWKGHIAALTGGDETLSSPAQFHWWHCATQAWKLIRTGDNRSATTILPLPQFVDTGGPEGVFIFEQFSHLPLVPYLGEKYRGPIFACPEDQARLSWQNAPLSMGTSASKPQKVGNGGAGNANLQWWPYSSSYQVLPAGIVKDRNPELSGSVHMYSQSTAHDRYQFDVKAPKMGGRRFDEVRFPAQKVAAADSQQRHARRDLFFAYPDARLPLLFWDSSVSVRKTGDANPGWNPLSPRVGVLTISYAPDAGFESPAINDPMITKAVLGRYRWTRGGLTGLDYSGHEVDTKKW